MTEMNGGDLRVGMLGAWPKELSEFDEIPQLLVVTAIRTPKHVPIASLFTLTHV